MIYLRYSMGVLFLVVALPLTGCTCYSSTSFDLFAYDYADAILEVVAGKRIVPEEKLDTEAYAAEVEKAKIEGRVPPPPPPPRRI